MIDVHDIGVMVAQGIAEAVISTTVRALPPTAGEARIKSGRMSIAKRLGIAETAALQITSEVLGKRLVMRTPIKTGKARAHWIASVGSPNLSFTTRTPYPGSDKADFRQWGYGTSVVKRNNAIIRSDAKAGDKVYFSNNVDYIHVLERGSSTQQPSGWIRTTVFEVKQSTIYSRAFLSAWQLGRRPERFSE